jgi:lysophospholipase L1-like esterase
MGETDHMHLDEEGHGKMAEILNEKIREIFNDKETR